MNKLIPVLIVALIGAAFFGGTMWGKLQVYEKGGAVAGTKAGTGGNARPAGDSPQQPQPEPIVEVSVDDDPVLGDKNAPVTIIEFSDYECPFCKRYFDDTFPQIKEKYIDTGKAKLVFRDLPLSFHDPMATKEAVAANCARKQGGDSKYFEYHDEIFKRTKSNGNGLNDGDLQTIASDVGLNADDFNSCQNDSAQTDEVKKDLAEAGKVGASGTPTFFIGKSTTDGVIQGERLVGAQPFSAFESIVDKYSN